MTLSLFRWTPGIQRHGISMLVMMVALRERHINIFWRWWKKYVSKRAQLTQAKLLLFACVVLLQRSHTGTEATITAVYPNITFDLHSRKTTRHMSRTPFTINRRTSVYMNGSQKNAAAPVRWSDLKVDELNVTMTVQTRRMPRWIASRKVSCWSNPSLMWPLTPYK